MLHCILIKTHLSVSPMLQVVPKMNINNIIKYTEINEKVIENKATFLNYSAFNPELNFIVFCSLIASHTIFNFMVEINMKLILFYSSIAPTQIFNLMSEITFLRSLDSPTMFLSILFVLVL